MIEREVAMQLKGVHQRVKQIMQSKISVYGLRFGQLHLLMLIEKYPDANQKDLAKEMRFTEGAMSVMVKQLIELKMLEQVPLELDMRYNRLVITKKGQAMIDDYQDELLIIYRDLFAGFTDEELVDLNRYLTLINNNLDDMNESNKKDNLESEEL
ncbi:MAG TPA: MarR family winged helix-turn-helix transcriptional regulator [Tissierellaceae bacterium]|nr:MarR family winged helix-turn-helix transcriptional regulator [Tissierellaceae bacterium]